MIWCLRAWGTTTFLHMSCRLIRVMIQETETTTTLQRMIIMDKPPKILDIITISMRNQKHAKIRLWTTVNLSEPDISKSLTNTTKTRSRSFQCFFLKILIRMTVELHLTSCEENKTVWSTGFLWMKLIGSEIWRSKWSRLIWMFWSQARPSTNLSRSVSRWKMRSIKDFAASRNGEICRELWTNFLIGYDNKEKMHYCRT